MRGLSIGLGLLLLAAAIALSAPLVMAMGRPPRFAAERARLDAALRQAHEAHRTSIHTRPVLRGEAIHEPHALGFVLAEISDRGYAPIGPSEISLVRAALQSDQVSLEHMPRDRIEVVDRVADAMFIRALEEEPLACMQMAADAMRLLHDSAIATLDSYARYVFAFERCARRGSVADRRAMVPETDLLARTRRPFGGAIEEQILRDVVPSLDEWTPAIDPFHPLDTYAHQRDRRRAVAHAFEVIDRDPSRFRGLSDACLPDCLEGIASDPSAHEIERSAASRYEVSIENRIEAAQLRLVAAMLAASSGTPEEAALASYEDPLVGGPLRALTRDGRRVLAAGEPEVKQADGYYLSGRFGAVEVRCPYR